MAHPIFISLSPNTRSRDIRLAATSLFNPRRWAAYASMIPDLQRQLEQKIKSEHAQLTSSGRSAIYEVLRAAGIGAGDEVLLQAFTCLAVPAAIMWAGATPVYVDIAPGSYAIDPNKIKATITPRTRAIIIQHTFGISARLNDILPIARQHNLFIIEDIAHALGGSYDGQPLGSFGDAAIVSFGRDKTISSVFGGAILSHRADIAVNYRRALATYSPPPARWARQQLLHPLVVNALLPLYFPANFGKILLVASQRLGVLSMAVTKQEKTAGTKPDFVDRAFHPALAPLLAEQLRQLPAFTEQRRAIAKRYVQAFGGSSEMQAQATSANWLRWPMWVKNKEALLAAARQQSMLLGDWYASPVAPTTLAQSSLTRYVPGSCPEAERAARHVINVPTHPRMTNEDVSRVIKFIQEHVNTSPPSPLLSKERGENR